ncbi:MAG: hypothetical protein AB7K09_15630 [Planctomycetota bacterium]
MWGKSIHSVKPRKVGTANLANGSSLSSAITFGHRSPSKLVLDGWEAGNVMTFDVTLDGTTYKPLTTRDGEYSIPDPTDTTHGDDEGECVVNLDPDVFFGVVGLKVRCGTAAAPVNAAGDFTIEGWGRRLH